MSEVIAKRLDDSRSLPTAPGEFKICLNDKGEPARLVFACPCGCESILGTSIVGVTADSVRVRKVAYLGDFSGQNPLPANYAHALPGIVICYFDTEEVENRTSAREEISYPITIVFAQQVQSASTPSESNVDPFLRWREAIRRVFVRLRGVPNHTITATASGETSQFYDCRFKGGMTFDPDRDINKKMDLGWMKLGFLVWQPGINA